MKIAYNPLGSAVLTVSPPENDITFDLPGKAIWAKGVKIGGYTTFLKNTSTGGGYDGLVPAPNYNNGSTNRFLKEDGTWDTPPNISIGIVSSTTNGLAPKIGTTTSEIISNPTDEWVLTSTKGGTPTWRLLPLNAFKNDNSNTTYIISGALSSNTYITTLTPSTGSATTATIPAMTAATSSTAGKAGLVPAPAKGDLNKILTGSGTWIALPTLSITDNETGNAVTDVEVSGHGITLKRGISFSVNGHKHSTADITALTSYTKATSISALATNDTLNVALGKLEYKADVAYNLVKGAYNGDGTIENLEEILKVLDGIKDTDTIQAIIGKYLPLSGGALKSSALEVLSIKTTNSIQYPGIGFYNGDTRIGVLRLTGDKTAAIYDGSFNTAVNIITSGNIGSQFVSYASSAGNADTVDGYHAAAFAKLGTYNDLTHASNEFTFASSAFSGEMWINYRTASGSTDGNITKYYFGNGKGSSLAYISDNYFSGTAAAAGSVAWSNITGKPSTFAPSAHDHSRILDVSNGSATTFAYSKSGLNYGDYTWLAGWNGYELRAVNKNQFATASHNHDGTYLKKVTVANNAENDFNSFESMTLTGRGDPVSGASLKNAPWSGSGPAGGYGVLTYLWSGYGTQMAWGYQSNKIYIRNKYYSSGSIWQSTWDSLALTSDLTWSNISGKPTIPTVTDYYWANVKVSSSSSTSTSPTFNNVTSTGLITASSAATHKGIKVGNTYINAIDGNLILLNNGSIRFGGDSWDYNVWAGLKYVHSSKTIYLGLADGTQFTANSAQSGGTFNLPGISTMSMVSDARIHASGGNLYLGNSNNAGWLMLQNVCSLSGSAYWNIYNNGSARFGLITSTVTTGTAPFVISSTTVNSNLNADLLDGLHLNSTTINNEANKVMRTDDNGYANFGWINTTSGKLTTTPDRVYASNDGYIRYMTPADFYKNTITVGSGNLSRPILFRSDDGKLYYANGIQIDADNKVLKPSSNNSGSLGLDTQRWNTIYTYTIYAATAFYQSSDARLKTNIQKISKDLLDRVYNINEVSFNWKDSGKQAFGYIAQDYEQISDVFVGKDENGTLSLDYTEVLVAQIAALKLKIVNLEERLQILERS